MDQNHLNNSGRRPPKDHLCEIISKLDQGFKRSCHQSQLLTNGRLTKADHKSSPCHYVTGVHKKHTQIVASYIEGNVTLVL